jgi:PAS domain S-box-containing protein
MGIVTPAVLAMAAFVALIFLIVIPALKGSIMDRKREMIRELTASAWSLVSEFEQQSRSGAMTRAQAQRHALERVRDLRYGHEGKDYFWITDLSPRMVMHPYVKELDGQDLGDYRDPHGKRLFVECVEVVKARGEGYVSYSWQWKDDATRIVPKLSYVRRFAPWGWIIGTGVYIEDVRQDIRGVTRHVVGVSLLIILGVAALLAYQGRQGWLLESRRRSAEAELRDSEARYRALVEAATEGILMVLEGRLAYANPTLRAMLRHDQGSFEALRLSELYPADDPCRAALDEAFSGRAGLAEPCLTRLRAKDGSWLPALLNASLIEISGRQGTIVTVKDVRAQQETEAELGSHRDRLRALAEHLDVGVFRADLERRNRLLEASAATWRILGLAEAPAEAELSAILPDAEDRADFLRRLDESGAVRDHLVRLPRERGADRFAAVHATLAREAGKTFCDGFITDVTAQRRLAQDRDRLLAETQSTLLPLSGPVGHCARPLPLCPHDWTVAKAAALMAKQGAGAALVTAGDGAPLGLLTSGDLLRRVLAVRADTGRPVREFMSAPVVCLPENALLFEAGQLMHDKDIGRLVVTDAEGRCRGLLERRDLLRVQRHSSALLIGEIASAPGPEEAAAAHARMPLVARAMVEAGAEAAQVTRLTAAVSDALVGRLVQLAVEELGPPPSPFAFMSLGSAGRQEQTLCADQDNAVIFSDAVPGAQEYFLSMGAKVCAGLAAAGYPYCNGKVMAREPKWCRPLRDFQEMFTRWTVELGDQDLCDVNISFDFRGAAGDGSLPAELRRHLLEAVRDKPRFLFHLAETTLQFKPPVGFFGNIQVEGRGAHAEAFSIKTAVVPIVNFARIYALRHGVAATNTLERLRLLRGLDVLTQTGYDELAQSYSELMRLRLKHQAALLAEGLPPDNHIYPKRLTELERTMLKRIFAHIAALQARLTTDFARTA